MKVKHLIDELKKCDPNSLITIKISIYDETLEEKDTVVSDDIIEAVEYENENDKWVAITSQGGCLVY